MSRTRVVLIVASLAIVPAVGLAQDALVQTGQAAFAAQKCSMCHSVAGKGNPKGPLDHVGAKLKAEEVREWLVNAKVMTTKTNATRKPAMKDYSALPKADIDALVAYLQSLK